MLSALVRVEVLAGVIAGVVGAVAAVTLDRRRRPAQAGTILVAAALTAEALVIEVPLTLMVTATITALFARSGIRSRPLVAMYTTAALGMGVEVFATSGWSDSLTAVVLTVGAVWLYRRFDGSPNGDQGLPLLAITAFGMFACLPDVEHAAVLLGAAVAFALLGSPFALMRLGQVGAAAVALLVVRTVLVDGRGRASAVLGAMGCMGMIVIAPLARDVAARVRTRRLTRGRAQIALLSTHVAIALAASRFVGLQPRMIIAVAGLLVIGNAALLVTVVMATESTARSA